MKWVVVSSSKPVTYRINTVLKIVSKFMTTQMTQT